MRISLLLIVSIFLIGCSSDSKVWRVFQEKDLLEHPPAKRCGECHQEIYKQWKLSRHSQAWISPTYKKATDNYSKTRCLKCHAPLEMSLNTPPKLRNKHQEDGVNCVSCHFTSVDKAMHGPYDVFSPPHPSKKDLRFRKSVACASCHRQTYNQWKKTGVKTSCQECHMQPVKKGKLIQKFPFNYLHFAKLIYNHQFPTGKIKSEELQAFTKKEKEKLILILINTSVPHNLPTADNGNPKLYVKVTFFNKGKEVDKQNYIITPKYALHYNEKYYLEFFTFYTFDKVKINIYRKLSWQEEKQLIKSFTTKL